MLTHRCQGSLDNKASIRFDYMSSISFRDDIRAWRLFVYRRDPEYDVCIKHHVAEIKYCPFCGKKLEEVEDGID